MITELWCFNTEIDCFTNVAMRIVCRFLVDFTAAWPRRALRWSSIRIWLFETSEILWLLRGFGESMHVAWTSGVISLDMGFPMLWAQVKSCIPLHDALCSILHQLCLSVPILVLGYPLRSKRSLRNFRNDPVRRDWIQAPCCKSLIETGWWTWQGDGAGIHEGDSHALRRAVQQQPTQHVPQLQLGLDSGAIRSFKHDVLRRWCLKQLYKYGLWISARCPTT